MKNTNQFKIEFRKNVAFRIAMQGALTRNSVYSKGVTELQKREFRLSLKAKLNKTLDVILAKNFYDNTYHKRMLLAFAKSVNKDHSKILKSRKITLGTSQKLVNLYWKMLWVFNDTGRRPIHCPFDSVIINKLPKNVQDIKWTTMDNIRDYSRLVKEVNKIAANNNLSIADWELKNYTMAIYEL